MHVAIIGAGFSGITTAKTLLESGHTVTVYEQCPDVGGVWSRTRRYPGVATQNSKDTYYLSDMKMPSHYPTWPSGEQVQAYAEAYVNKHDLLHVIKLGTTVVHALPTTSGWEVHSRSTGTREPLYIENYGHLVICIGIFCKGAVPRFKGDDTFGGKVVHSCEMGGMENVLDKHVVVIGYGKSACDVANAIEPAAASSTLVARRLIWKLPRKIYGLPYQYLLLTRFGEALFEYIRPGTVEKFLNGLYGSWVRNGLLGVLQGLVTRQLGLDGVGLVPPGRFEDIARSTISLSTEGLYDKIRSGRVKVFRDTHIVELRENTALLSDGQTVPCDMVVCATGYQQKTPFLSQDIQDKMLDEDGNWLLYRHILPIGVDNLSFNGYNSSLFCPTSSEAAALYIAAHLTGKLDLPSRQEQMDRTVHEVAWLEERSKGKHAHGTNLVPFSLHSIDDVLDDLGVNITAWARFRQWLLPVRPSDYAGLGQKMREKFGAGPADPETDGKHGDTTVIVEELV